MNNMDLWSLSRKSPRTCQVSATPPDKAVVRRLLQGLEAAALGIPGMVAE